jgi:hypothetical protein
VVFALDLVGLLRGEWCFGRSRLGVKNPGVISVLVDSPLIALRLFADFYTPAPMESNIRRMREVHSSG